MKHTKKMSRRIGYILVLVVAAAALSTGTMFTFFMSTSGSHGVGRLWEITNNSGGAWSSPVEMGDYFISWTTSGMVGGDVDTFEFNITLSGNSNANKRVYFGLTEDDLVDGVNLTIWNLDTTTEITDGGFVEFTPGSTVHFQYEVTVDDYTPEGSYTTGLLLTKS